MSRRLLRLSLVALLACGVALGAAKWTASKALAQNSVGRGAPVVRTLSIPSAEFFQVMLNINDAWLSIDSRPEPYMPDPLLGFADNFASIPELITGIARLSIPSRGAPVLGAGVPVAEAEFFVDADGLMWAQTSIVVPFAQTANTAIRVVDLFRDLPPSLLRGAVNLMVLTSVPMDWRISSPPPLFLQDATDRYRTDEGKEVETFPDGWPRTPDVSEDRARGEMSTAFGLLWELDITVTGGPTDSYNCCGLVFADERRWIEPTEVNKILSDNDYEEVTGPKQVGDVYLYGFYIEDIQSLELFVIKHVAVVVRVDGDQVIVRSKFGNLFEGEHRADDERVKSAYGGSSAVVRTERQGGNSLIIY